jgi:hypothetical protein
MKPVRQSGANEPLEAEAAASNAISAEARIAGNWMQAGEDEICSGLLH